MTDVRFYPARRDAALPFARVPRMIVQLADNGAHCHAFRGLDGAWRITERDIMRGRVTRQEAAYLTWRLAGVL